MGMIRRSIGMPRDEETRAGRVATRNDTAPQDLADARRAEFTRLVEPVAINGMDRAARDP